MYFFKFMTYMNIISSTFIVILGHFKIASCCRNHLVKKKERKKKEIQKKKQLETHTATQAHFL